MDFYDAPWTPPRRPDPSTLTHPPPFPPLPLHHLRTGKIRPLWTKPSTGATITSAIYKEALPFPVTITPVGIVGDEHAFGPHNNLDRAIHHYSSAHYALWASEIPDNAHIFEPGAFGENLFSEELDETTVCIGDKVRIGGVLLELSEPRTPCYKLNHRFKVKNMANRMQTLLRTGWMYRVLEPGVVESGAVIELVERPHPEWTVARVAYYLFLEKENLEMAAQLVALGPLADEIKERFQSRLEKAVPEGQAGKSKEQKMDTWAEYRLVDKKKHTSTVTAFVFEAVDKIKDEDVTPVEPGSHVRVKLGGKLVRAYSVVGGTSKRFELGIALDPESRGGSKYMHSETKVGDVLTFGRITASFPLAKDADKHIIIAGGIGITAFLAALEYLHAAKQNYELHFAVSSELPFAAQIATLGAKAKTYNKALGQRMDLKSIIAKAEATTHVYTCGPQRLMDGVGSVAKEYGVPDTSVHFEQFTVTTSGNPFTAELKKSGKVVEVGPTQSLLDALKAVGMNVDSSCEVGNCGTCLVDVCAGRAEHRGTGIGEEEKKGFMLSCVSRGVGKIVLDL